MFSSSPTLAFDLVPSEQKFVERWWVFVRSPLPASCTRMLSVRCGPSRPVRIANLQRISLGNFYLTVFLPLLFTPACLLAANNFDKQKAKHLVGLVGEWRSSYCIAARSLDTLLARVSCLSHSHRSGLIFFCIQHFRNVATRFEIIYGHEWGRRASTTVAVAMNCCSHVSSKVSLDSLAVCLGSFECSIYFRYVNLIKGRLCHAVQWRPKCIRILANPFHSSRYLVFPWDSCCGNNRLEFVLVKSTISARQFLC